jgi:hypothetical protein
MPFVMALFRCTGFVDVETGTNPIDRSIAHLLFHRPSDASVMPVNNAFSHKSHALVSFRTSIAFKLHLVHWNDDSLGVEMSITGNTEVGRNDHPYSFVG